MSVRISTVLGSCLLLAACGDDGGTGPRVCEVEVRLQPGQALVTDAPVDEPGCGLVLPAGANGDRYRIALLRPDSAAPSSSPEAELRVVVGEPTLPALTGAAPVAPLDPRPESAPSGLPSGLTPERATARLHERLRAEEKALVETLGTRGLLASRTRGPWGAGGAAAALAPAPARFVFDPRTTCQGARTPRAALLLAESETLAIYQDSVELPGQRLAAEHVERMLAFFGEHGREAVTSYFGDLPDVDGDGRVQIVVSANAFSDAQVVAYVWAGNYYDRDDCPASDEAEVIFFNPARIRSMAQGEFIALGVMSHEAAHLVSLYHRLRRTLSRGSATFLSHPTWMEEGRAELADEVTSRLAWSRTGGPARNAKVRGADLVERGFTGAPARCCRAEAYGVALQAARTIWYLSSQPNGLVVAPNGGIAQTDIRNGGWHFHRWVGDTFGGAGGSPGGDAVLFRRLTDSLTASGREGLETVLGRSFDALLGDFVSSVLLHDAGAPLGAPGFSTYGFVSLTDVRLAGPNLDPPGEYPWPVTVDDGQVPASLPLESASYRGPIGPTGIRVHDFTSTGATDDARVTVHGVPGLKLVVARLR